MYRGILDKKNGAIGETLTWFAATLIIIGALIIFLLLSSLVAKVKVLNNEEATSDIAEESPVLVVKTFIAHDIADDRNKENIDNILEEWNKNE